ncbi:MAG: hypothetical protein GC204_09010 [Chloroflexi bacterium]|nr:hypothetical protein [Chloroflexota bacterium]
MSSTQTFNYDTYKRGFRAACAQRGIDPLAGATSYQVVHLLADHQRAEQRRIARRTRHALWWSRHKLWVDCPPYRSETEEEAFWELFRETYLLALFHYMRARRRWQMARSLREFNEARHRRK